MSYQPTHRCHALGCRSICSKRFLMCGRHWKMVPLALQLEVYAGYAERSSRTNIDRTWVRWWRAAHRAMHAVAVLERPQWDGAEAWLKHQLELADKLEQDEADEQLEAAR